MIDNKEKSKICWNCISYDRDLRKCVNDYPEKEKLNFIENNKNKEKRIVIFNLKGEVFLCKKWSRNYNKWGKE